ncbi:hypothetical protein BUQ74_21210, partial [Leptospira weilii serovar Heyan]
MLNMLLTDVPQVYDPVNYSNRRLALASARTMLPQYNWVPSREFATRPEIISHINSLINSPPGSIWLGVFSQLRPDGTMGWHSVPILRDTQGLVVIQTNAYSVPFDLYREYLTPTTDPFQVMNYLELPNRILMILITIQLREVYHNTFDFIISNRNCTGEGDDRRGTGGYPTSASVNQ